METIILIETSAALCSVALAQDGKTVSYRESTAPKAHASLTAVFVDELLSESGLGIRDCSAVCVSMGPGSYTGLRVGVSTAKGLCFGAGLPLLAVGTLDVLASQAIKENALPEGCVHIVPMIDARRMEVYTSLFSADGKQLSETAPLIVGPGSFDDVLSRGPVLFVGDAADKVSEVIAHPNAFFRQTCPKASSMAELAAMELRSGKFRDIAYFEPFYLKEFVATVSKKKVF